MVGEIGLDGGARMRWPSSARHFYPEKVPRKHSNTGLGGREEKQGEEERREEEEGEEGWKRLTPFKTCMSHQKMIAERQLELAIKLGVNVSFHSVAAPGNCSISSFFFGIDTLCSNSSLSMYRISS